MNISALTEKIYRDFSIDITRRLFHIFGAGPPDPEDLLQEAFSKMISNENIEQIEYPKAYLIRSAVNLGLNYYNKHKNTQSFIDSALEDVGEPISPEGSPEDLYTLTQRVNTMAKAMERLTPKQKEIVLRSRINGETYEQIKHNTGWSLADISRQLHDALGKLQSETLTESE